MFSWIRSHGPLALGIGIVLVATLMVAGYRTYDFVENDPRFCNSCHTMGEAFHKYTESKHAGISCHGCHEAYIADNLHQLWVYVTQRPDVVTKHAEVPNKVCLKCHEKEKNERPEIARLHIEETPGHRQHTQNIKIECTQCHSKSLHQFAPPVDTCKDCHKKQKIMAAGMEEQHCLTCHSFAKLNHNLKPGREECLDCHLKDPKTKATFPEAGPMHWDCGKCHKPHEKPKLKREDCVACHDKQLGTGVHTVKVHNGETCTSCHKPHAWKVTGRETCTTCHEDYKDHNAPKACVACHNAKQLKPTPPPAPEGEGEGEGEVPAEGAKGKDNKAEAAPDAKRAEPAKP